MYRKVIVLAMVLTAVFCGSAFAEKNVKVPVQEYYGTGNINKYDKYSLTFEENAIEEERGAEDPVYHISGISAAKLAHTSGKDFLAPVSYIKEPYAKIRISLDIKIVGGEMGFAIRCRQYADKNYGSTGSAFSPMDIAADDLADGEWHSLAVEFSIDGSSGDYTAYLDGSLYTAKSTTAGYGIDFVRLQPVCAEGEELDYYLDNIVFSYEKEVPELLNVNEGDDVSYDATEIIASLDGELGVVAPENLKLSSIFGEIKVSKATLSKNSLSITPAEKLVSGTEYTLTLLPEATTPDGSSIVEEQSVTFTTTTRPLDITDVSLTVDSTLNFSGTVVDDSSSISARLIVVLYNADGRIQHVEIGNASSSGPVGATVPVSGANSAKIFCVTGDFRDVIGEKIFTYIGGQN